MSTASHAGLQNTPYQPFQCDVCQRRFTRNENLKRHAALHTRLHARKHPQQEDARIAKRSCQNRRTPAKPTSTAGRNSHVVENDTDSSVSPAGRGNSWSSQQSGDDVELQADYEVWSPGLRYVDDAQHEKDIDLIIRSANMNLESRNFHADASPITQQSRIHEPPYITHFTENAYDLGQNQLSGSFATKHADFLGNQVRILNGSRSTPSMDRGNFSQDIPDSLLANDLSSIAHEDWFPSVSQIARGVDLYFTHVLHFVPFIHRPTFDASQAPCHLILSMLSLAYRYGEDPDNEDQAGSGTSLSTRCFYRARTLLASMEQDNDDESNATRGISMIQAYLLLQICATMYLCGKSSEYGPQMHSKLIILARSTGLMQPMQIESSATADLDSLWREFIKAESHKRTLFTIHQIDSLWYQFFSVPRLLSHLEIKHDLPCPEDSWTASSSAQWAHGQLLLRQSGPGSSMQYADAVRYFLSSNRNFSSLPPFDPYGAINIAQFLISSAREITGWSTMTGRLSVERLEPITSSLVALEPFIRPQAHRHNTKNMYAALCEATWEMAMIEIQIWSPSHTGGIVGGSVDEALKIATDLAPLSYEILVKSNGVIQPHVDWFLRYLDSSAVTPISEPPWITLYAYKTFLIAWQMVRGGLAGAMQAVGVRDGDLKGAMAWARKVFERRQGWQLGKIIMKCLDVLENELIR
ncbi:conserved hypothetical protein [Talaromyces stipitatus ATCC 10500]|uniref:C2H2-type domain-containing protein n=1 Tax=Talaromyces stipitatus (strain ATCC 10500 / CBS 375.48 / QM 6759 / NRRL 1006) TaxID=441959 RepID=B8MJU4_TALSN|nr:uncharacterized protein TSTA_042360 [Talaromyces stipitatus ATCC 10500]EED14761.1 conserved hypothetical protein [Talaromyces stipitatus ATCC 10500]